MSVVGDNPEPRRSVEREFPRAVEPPWPLEETQDALVRMEELEGMPLSGEATEAVVEFRRAGELLADFFRDLMIDEVVPREAPSVLAEEVSVLHDALRRVRVVGHAARDLGALTNEMAAELRGAASGMEEALFQIVQGFLDFIEAGGVREEIELAVRPTLDRYSELLEARRFRGEARQARDEAVEARDATRAAAGVTGETQLSAHFSQYARREFLTAEVLRVLAALILILITAAAVGAFGSDYSATSEDWGRLFASVPLALLAAYLGRESGRHRAAGRWAKELEIQLLTLDAFSAPLPDALRDQLRMDLGRRAFTAPLPGGEGSGPSSLNEAAGAIDSVAALVKSSRR